MREQMINYLQMQLSDLQKEISEFGADSRIAIKKYDALIACKEMVEAIIEEPINLMKDGTVTIGY